MSLSSSQCSIDSKSDAYGSRDFVFVKREGSGIGLGLLHLPEFGKGEPSVVWTNMDLPATLRKEMIAKVELVKKLPAEPVAQLEHLVKLGGEMGYHELCYGVVYMPMTVIWASSSGIVALSRENGSVIQHWDSALGANRLWVDEAICSITVDSEFFELPTKRGGGFIADCHRDSEQLLIYFNGVELIVISSSNTTGALSTLHRVAYDHFLHKAPSTSPSKVKMIMNPSNKIQIILNGTVFL